MSNRSLVRDLTLLAAAGLIGWWAHRPGVGLAPVFAQHGGSDVRPTEGNLAFQYGGLGPDGELTLYNPGTRTLYVYPSIGRSSNSHINCLYSIRVDRAGAPLDRENCPVGSFR